MAPDRAMSPPRGAEEVSDSESVSSEATSAERSSVGSPRRSFDNNAEAGPSRPRSLHGSTSSLTSRAISAQPSTYPTPSGAISNPDQDSSDDDEASAEPDSPTRAGPENGSRHSAGDEDSEEANAGYGEEDEEEDEDSEDEDEDEEEGEEEEPCVIVLPT